MSIKFSSATVSSGPSFQGRLEAISRAVLGEGRESPENTQDLTEIANSALPGYPNYGNGVPLNSPEAQMLNGECCVTEVVPGCERVYYYDPKVGCTRIIERFVPEARTMLPDFLANAFGVAKPTEKIINVFRDGSNGNRVIGTQIELTEYEPGVDGYQIGRVRYTTVNYSYADTGARGTYYGTSHTEINRSAGNGKRFSGEWELTQGEKGKMDLRKY